MIHAMCCCVQGGSTTCPPHQIFFCLMGQLQTAISQRVYVVVRRDKAHSRSTSKEDSKTAETASRARNVDVWFWPYLCTVITLSFWCHWSQKMTSKESPSLVESSRHLKLEQLISRCEVICRWNDCFCVLCKNILLANSVSFGGQLAAVADLERSTLPLKQWHLKCVYILSSFVAEYNLLWQKIAQKLLFENWKLRWGLECQRAGESIGIRKNVQRLDGLRAM